MTKFAQDPKSDSAGTQEKKGNIFLRIAAWAVAGALTLVMLSLVTIAILQHNEHFHNYILATAQQRATEALGVPVHLQNFALNLAHLDLDLYGVTVEGAAPYAHTHLLEVDHAEVSARITSILHRKWYLQSVRIDRPIVRVFVDAGGASNLPKISSSGSSDNSTNVFDFGVRHATLDGGEVYYNDRKSVLSADVHELAFSSSFDASKKKYMGSLSYADGHLVSGTLKTIPHSLEAEFDATPAIFNLSTAKLSAGASKLLVTARLQNYSNPIADARYDTTIDCTQIGQILSSSSVPKGQVRATGVLHYQQIANRSLLDSIAVSGDLNSGQLEVATTSIQTRVTNLAAHYALANGNGKLTDLKVNLLGGELTGDGTMTDLAGNSHSKVEARLRGMSLDQLKHLVDSSQSTRDVRLGGGLSADLSATWGKTFKDLVAHADATIHGQVSGTPQNPKKGAVVQSTSTGGLLSSGIPLEGAIHGVYDATNQQLELNKSYIRTPQTTLSMDGKVSDRSNLDLRLKADDLQEVEAVADIFRKPTPGQTLQPLGLSGTASFQATVRGSVSAPHLDGLFIATNLHAMGSKWKVIRTNIQASPDAVSLRHGDLEPMTRGHINIDVSAGLDKWSFTKNSTVDASIDAAQIDVAEMTKLSGQQIPVRGTLTANVKVHGTELSPVGSGTIVMTDLVAYDQAVPLLKATFAGTGDDAHADLVVHLPAGSIQGNVAIKPRDRSYTGRLTSTGIELAKLQALKSRNIDASGEVSLSASGRGSFDNPQLDARVTIPKLVVQQQTITGVDLTMKVADHVANATLATSVANAGIQAKARISLTGDYLADATFDTQAIPFQPLIAIYAPEQAGSLSGETELHAALHGPLKDKNRLEGRVTIPTFKMAYGSNIQLAAASPIHIDYKNGIIDLQRTSIKGTDTDLQLQGSVPVNGSAAPMSVVLLGTVNLQLAQLFNPQIRTSGEMKLDINSSGTSDFGGRIDIVNAGYSSTDLPVGLKNGNGTLTLNRDRISITKFQGTVGGGSMTAQGGVSLRPNVQFDLGLKAQGIRMLYPQGMREGVDADLNLAGTTESAVLGGSVNITDVSFTNAFDLNSFIGQFAGGVSTPPTPGLSQNVRLNLNVRSASDINLVSRTLSVDGSANLQVRGTASNPVILGRVNLNNGDIILNGDRFVLEGGTVQFVNPSETEPVLNVSLKTTIQQYDVYLRFNGPVDQLRTNYNSDPALPSADIINLLAFGKTTEADTANAATPANQAAAGLIASQVSSQVTSRVSKIAGISQLSINPVLAGGTSAGQPGANITIQQRVTGNLFVTFSSNVASTQSQTIQGQYQLSPRVALSATRDQNGGFAFDALIKKSW